MNAQITAQPDVKVGDFFSSSWGYDQTNVDFYRVIALTPSGKSVKVQAWSMAFVENDGPHDRVKPSLDPAMVDDWSDVPEDCDYNERRHYVKRVPSEIMTKRLSAYPGTPSFRVNSYSHAYLWDGKPQYQTGRGYGH